MNWTNLSVSNSRRLLLTALLCFGGLESRGATATNELVSANCGFAFNLLQQLVTNQPGSNIFISPYSASTVLQMVSVGAGGTTRTQMEQALDTTDLSIASLNEANQEISAIINRKNTNFVLTSANAFWYQEGFPIKSAFIHDNEEYFGARVGGVNFGEATSADIINDWASNVTRAKIDKVVSFPFPPNTRLLLANAVYFLGNWQTPFDTNNTADQAFYLSGGGQTTIPMMQQLGEFSYYKGSNYQAVRLPYKGGDLAMYVFLPDTDSSVEELLATMSGAWWQQAISSNFVPQWGTVGLPRFNLNYAANLKAPLQALGMEIAFAPGADFSNISREPLYIEAVQQQAVVEVNEKGTEAAAVTTVTIVGTAIVTPQFQMIADRPFLFFIEDEQTGMILFTGAVFNP
jgi:serpin B